MFLNGLVLVTNNVKFSRKAVHLLGKWQRQACRKGILPVYLYISLCMLIAQEGIQILILKHIFCIVYSTCI